MSGSSDNAAVTEAASGYLASEAHYLSVAGRILAALRGDGRVVLVTGDPTADPQPLSEALRKLAGSRHRVIGISCGPELTGEEVSRAGSVVATLAAGSGTVTISDTAETDAPLFLLDEAERLSDQQLGEICSTIQRGAKQNAAGVLLARRGFLARLEQPPLQFLRERLALRLCFDEIGDDEGIDFLRHQLAVRHSQDETHRGRPIFLRSLAGLGVLAAIGVGASLALHYVRMPDVKTPDEQSVRPAANPPAANTPAANPPAANPAPSLAPLAPPPRAPSAAVIPPTPEPPKPQPAPAAPAPAPLRPEQKPQPDASVGAPAAPPVAAPPQTPPPPVQSPAGQHLSATEIAALVNRGDAFLSGGDIASARLFYERAADAGDSVAALR
ncbi:MAG TPA: hypothetical protein VH230_14990, partial [Stellaceae bacterium]|nr:hypothetical protein [Stellaceae bacterium]